jgi:acetolactate synthase-1/2/3 large subunit
VVLMDNSSLGLVFQQQTLFYGDRIYASKFNAAPDFAKVAEGFGLRAVDLDRESDPAAALARVLSERGPALIHASIDVREKVWPMVPPGAANKEMIGG